MVRLILRAIAGAALLAALAAPSVLAHAELTAANPGPDDVVTGSPARIVARFSQNLDASRTSLEVRASDGTRVARGGDIDPDNPRRIILAVPDLVSGTYEVRWTSFSSEDGELARGSYEFAVIAAPTPTTSPTPAVESSPSASATPTVPPDPTPSPDAPSPTPSASPPPSETDETGASVLVPIVAAGALVTAIAAWILRRR